MLTPLCARTAASSVAAEPSCRYGAVTHTSRSVGMSMPLSAPPRRWPLLGLSVPMFTAVFWPEPVNAAPAWQLAQFRLWNSVRPLLAAVLSAPLLLRAGVLSNVASEPT